VGVEGSSNKELVVFAKGCERNGIDELSISISCETYQY